MQEKGEQEKGKSQLKNFHYSGKGGVDNSKQKDEKNRSKKR